MRKTGKEIIEENKVSMTLFIGMGGIGSKIIKGVADKCEGTELTNVNFVVFDTNANDLEDVKDSKNNMYFVQTSSVSTVGDYLRVDKDAMDNWFPRNEVMYGKSMTDGAGQVRAISRLALNSTIKLNHMKPLYDAISDLYRKNGEELKYELRIVMAFSANGGTGSGMALPLSMLLRKYIKDEYPTTTVNIRGLCVLPSVQNSKITSETEKRSLRRNAYATIREINAFMMKGSGFLDNNPKLERYSDIHIDVPIAGSDEVLRLDSLPFNFCFLLDGTDAEDKTTPSQDQYIEQASLCLYEQNIGAMKKNSFGIEDNIVKESIDKYNLGRNRFGGLGASVIRYPYEEISKYIAYKWAMDRMGGKNSADNWCQYDESYFDLRKQEKEDGKDESEMTPRAVAYTDAMNDENGDEFTRRMYNKYIKNIEEKDIIDGYFDSLETRIMEVVDEICGNVRTKADKAAKNEAIKSENVANGKRVANQKLGAIREYAEFAGKRTIDKKIKREAESIFWNRIYGKKEDREWFLENVLTYNNEFMHPNAMRYVLYKIKTRMDEEIDKANNLRDKEKGNIEKFWTAKTDVLSTGKKDDEKESETIKTIADEFDDNNKIKSELAKKMADALNSRKNSYYSSVEKFVKNKAMSIVYSVGIAYLKELNKAFEEFYDSFDEKIEIMARTQEDLAESLIYKPGSTVYNLCGQPEYLERIAKETKRESDDDILSPDLCAKIFDSLKQNVQLMRHNRYADEDKLKDEIDVFDEIIIEHFEETVVNECDNIDLNVIQAMEKECMLKHKIKMGKLHKSTSLKADDKRKKVARYIRYIVKKGYDLAAPGIQRMSDSEAREVKLCAYNETLDNLKAFDTEEIFADFNPSSTDTVSKYELRFFNGLYNITPDRIRKFACSLTDKVGTRDAGIYFQAYQEYSADIGPDSEKCKVISTHIDKRWDPVRDFPELDMEYQKKKLAEIQRAYIYSLIFEIVKYRSVSDIDTTIKHYRYENSDEKLEDMIVSNGTPCDEYYEVLDHFYISSATVKDVSEQINKRITRDKNRRVNFDKTSFAKALKDFKIPHSHTDDTSLFEILLAYYSSIPSSIRIDSELEELTTAIVEVLKEQIAHYENARDRQVLLWKLLKEQFDLMIRNYPKTELLNCNMKLYEHPVVEIIFRAIKKELTEEYNEKIIDEMRMAIGREKSK